MKRFRFNYPLCVCQRWRCHGNRVWTAMFCKIHNFHCRQSKLFQTYYRAFSLTWPASMQIYWNKRKRLHKKSVQHPRDWFGSPTWPPFHCFGIPIWPPWRHVKTLYMSRVTPKLVYCSTFCRLIRSKKFNSFYVYVTNVLIIFATNQEFFFFSLRWNLRASQATWLEVFSKRNYMFLFLFRDTE